MTQDTEITDFIVVGGGPTGLAAATEALRHGLTVRIVERRATRSPHSRALVLHARTLEVLELLGCAEQMVQAGQRFRALHVRTATDASPVRVDLLDRQWGDTRYPFWLSLPQFEVERLLEERLSALGGSIEWSTELTALDDRGEHVVATLTTATGARVEHRARWVLGCDGGRSATREQVGISLPRAEVGVTFALADVFTACDLVEAERQPIARQMVRATSLATRVLTLRNPLARALRGLGARLALRFARFKDQLGHGVGMLDLRSAGLPRLPNPELPGGGRLHDRVDPRQPTRLQWEGRELLVRPDRIVARPGSLPQQVSIPSRGG